MGKADLHTHTKYSGLSKVMFLQLPDSVSEPREVVRSAEDKGLDVLCVTDHNTTRGGLEARKAAEKVEVVVGEEIGTSEGEVLGLFLSEDIPPGLTAADTVDRIHDAGGVAVAPHPYSSHCSALGDKVLELELDGIEAFNAFHRDRYSNDLALRRCSGAGVAMTGGSDAHAPMMVGDGYTIFEGTTGEDLRKAIEGKRTKYGGDYTSMRNVVWMTTTLVLSLQRAIAGSMLRPENDDDTEYMEAVFRMKRSAKIVSLGASLMFLMPPTTLVASLVADRVHTSRSRENWLRHIRKASRVEDIGR